MMICKKPGTTTAPGSPDQAEAARVFSAFGATLDAGEFVIGSAAADADDFIIYDAATGALYYDADGDGAGAAVQFATLGTGLALTAADIAGGP